MIREYRQVVADLVGSLPSFVYTPTRTEADYYGASCLIAQQIGKTTTPKSRASWLHGWVPGPVTEPQQLLFGDEGNSAHLVGTEDESRFLRTRGIKHVHAVGLPFVYVSPSNVSRISRSLLVMPAHSLPDQKVQRSPQKYVSQIAALKDHFSIIVACVHTNCLREGIWHREFERVGIPWITGAAIHDRNALLRMRMIFDRFEYVTTNCLGSHIPYAAHCGCKVSFYGCYDEHKVLDEETDRYARGRLQAVRANGLNRTEQFVRGCYSDMFVSPSSAVEKREWAGAVLGVQHKRPPTQIAHLLGWNRLDTRLKAVSASVKATTAKCIGAFLPESIQHIRRVALQPEYREINRLGRLPKYISTTTTILGKQVTVPDASSFGYMYQRIVKDEIYRFRPYGAKPLIVDGGANMGLSVIFFKQKYPESRVIAFEPDPEMFKILEANCASFDFEDVELVPKALWSCETTLQFWQEGSDAGRLVDNGDANGKTLEVSTARLRDYLDQKVDLLKLDVEGAETELLEDCADLLPNVENLFVEYHSFADKPQTLSRLLHTLEQAEFRVHVHAPPEACWRKPFFARRVGHLGFDCLLEIFAYREIPSFG